MTNLLPPDSQAIELALARAIARAIAELKRFDESLAAGPAPWVTTSTVTLALWEATHGPERRERIAARVEKCRGLLGRIMQEVTG